MTRPAAGGSGIHLDHLLSLAAAEAAAAAYPSSLDSGQSQLHPSTLLGAVNRFTGNGQQEPRPARGSSLAYAAGTVPFGAVSLPRLIHQQHKGRHYHHQQPQQPQQQQAVPAVLKRIDRFLSLESLSSEDDAGSSSSGTPGSSTSSILFRLDCALESISAGGEGSCSPLSAGPPPHFPGQSTDLVPHFMGQPAAVTAAAANVPPQLQYMAAAAAEPCGPHISSCGMMPKMLQQQQQQLAWATDHYPMYVPAPLYVDHSSPAALMHTNELLAGACIPGAMQGG